MREPKDLETRKHRARNQLRTAMQSGKVVKPDVCEGCGKNPGRAVDGRSKLHGHHEDYSKPFDVTWMCTACHKEVTPHVIGEQCGSAKLTKRAVLFIRKARTNGTPLAKLAIKYGVSVSSISSVALLKTWGHI